MTRRGFDGTATVELRWEPGSKRRVLFIQGEPKVWDTFQPMTHTRTERGWVIRSGDDEFFDIPEPLVYGG